MSNYEKGPWDGVTDAALNSEAAHQWAMERLAMFPLIDHHMDTLQDEAYNLLWGVVQVTDDHEARTAVEQALELFERAEHLEAINEEHVAATGHHVGRARVHNHKVIGIAEEERREAAVSQVTARSLR